MSVSKKNKWIQEVVADIKKKGTSGICTGKKFGSSSCPKGSKRYNLALTFRKLSNNNK